MNKFSTPAGTAQPASTMDQNPAIQSTRRDRYFFVVMAVLFPILVLLGFVPDYQVILSGEVKVHWFTHVHGAIMTAWLGVFLMQSVLAVRGKLALHRKLGLLSVGLGVLVWLTMGIVTFRALIGNNPPMADGQFDILFIQLYGMLLFGVFFTWGILVRKNGASHKRLLLLATLVIMQAAIDRIRFLPGIQAGVFPRFLYLDALLIPLFIYDWLMFRRIHTITGLGLLLIGSLQVGIILGWESPVWHQFWFNRISPFVEQVVEVKLSNAQTAPLLGDYGDKTWHMTVSHVDSLLYLQLPGQPRLELGAISDTRLFVRTINWKLLFVKGPDGRVTKVINDQISIVWEARRLK
ncbi:hypothetical protein [Spirosoma endbachense]|uniref:DUF2306 domain-containing protein n=1 Tax=Spirosoma endbachense TaxID=2666025 RepID=A0A6P1W5H5_9BACT|nr:hypothetical protein [Spirosoma endbachense]QHW00145.1 hypothetical protein GJR95_36275 [Spirosoma endbachense]